MAELKTIGYDVPYPIIFRFIEARTKKHELNLFPPQAR